MSHYDYFLNQEHGKENWRLEETRGNQQPPDEEVRGVAVRAGEGSAGGPGGPGGEGEPGRAPAETHCEFIPTALSSSNGGFRIFRIAHWSSRIFYKI